MKHIYVDKHKRKDLLMRQIWTKTLILSLLLSGLCYAEEKNRCPKDLLDQISVLLNIANENYNQGNTAEGTKAYESFLSLWKKLREETDFRHKRLFVDAGICLYNYGNFPEASEALYAAMEDAGLTFSPKAPYYLSKSLISQELHPLVCGAVTGRTGYYKDLSQNQKQDLLFMMATAKEKEGAIAASAKILERVIIIDNKSDLGKKAKEKLKCLEENPPGPEIINKNIEQCIDGLIKLIQDVNGGFFKRKAAIYALVRLSPKFPAEIMENVAKVESCWQLQLEAIRLLGDHKPHMGRKLLQDILGSDSENIRQKDLAKLYLKKLEEKINTAPPRSDSDSINSDSSKTEAKGDGSNFLTPVDDSDMRTSQPNTPQ